MMNSFENETKIKKHYFTKPIEILCECGACNLVTKKFKRCWACDKDLVFEEKEVENGKR